MKLYIRSPGDAPHRMSDEFPDFAECGTVLIGAQEITEAQAQVYLGNVRCQTCFPFRLPGEDREYFGFAEMFNEELGPDSVTARCTAYPVSWRKTAGEPR